MRTRELRPGSPSAWQAIPFLLGAEATILLVWQVSEFQYSPLRSDIDDLASMLLGMAPLLTILVALGFGWIERRRSSTLTLVGMTLVGPALIFIELWVSFGFPQGLGPGLGGLFATPACTAAAAGLVAGLRRRSGRGYVLLVCGGVVGFLAVALPMSALAIGHLAECPVGCNDLEMRGIGGGASAIGFIGLVAMTPGFAIGSLVGRQLGTASRQEST